MPATKLANTKGYNIECINCHNPIRVIPPKPECELILTQPCPMCDGLEQSIDCNNCYHKNTIYWDERHFVRKANRKLAYTFE